MTESTVVFIYHFVVGSFFSAVIGFFWARSVATTQTQVKNYNGDVVTTMDVDGAKFRRTWLMFALSMIGLVLLGLIVWEVRGVLDDMGYLGE
jgi:hypothetical protein